MPPLTRLAVRRSDDFGPVARAFYGLAGTDQSLNALLAVAFAWEFDHRPEKAGSIKEFLNSAMGEFATTAAPNKQAVDESQASDLNHCFTEEVKFFAARF